MLGYQNNLGAIAVELFFVLSGFSLTIGYWNKSIETKPFFAKRVLKIYPLYFITFLLGGIYMLAHQVPLISIALKAPFHILMSQTLIPRESVAISFNSASWYVATLVWIYAFFPWMLKRLKTGGGKFALSIAIYFLLICAIHPLIERWGQNVWFYYLSPFTRIVDFGIGMMGGALYKRRTEIFAGKSNRTMTLMELSSLVAIVLYIVYVPRFDVWYTPLGLLFVGSLLIFSQQRGAISKFADKKYIASWSSYTMPFYLIHYLITLTVVNWVASYAPPGFSIVNILSMILCFGLCVISAYLLKMIDDRIGNRLSQLNILKKHQ